MIHQCGIIPLPFFSSSILVFFHIPCDPVLANIKFLCLMLVISNSDIYRNWITFTEPDPKHLIWNAATSTIGIVNFEKAITFNNLGLMRDPIDEHINRTLPTRFQSWSNTWFADWSLSEDAINPFTTGTDGTVLDDDVWPAKYRELVLQEPRMPEASLKHEIVGVGGAKIEENAERRECMVQLAVLKKMEKERCEVM